MRVWPVLLLAPLLAGCTDSDWERLLGFGSDNARRQPVAIAQPARAPVATAAPAPTQPPAAAPAAAQAAASLNPFCLGVARQDAMTQDFDTGTQQRVAARSYQQCVQIFGNEN